MNIDLLGKRYTELTSTLSVADNTIIAVYKSAEPELNSISFLDFQKNIKLRNSADFTGIGLTDNHFIRWSTAQNKFVANALIESEIPNLPASKITSGTFNEARIPNLPISRIIDLGTELNQREPIFSKGNLTSSTLILSNNVGRLYGSASLNIEIDVNSIIEAVLTDQPLLSPISFTYSDTNIFTLPGSPVRVKVYLFSDSDLGFLLDSSQVILNGNQLTITTTLESGDKILVEQYYSNSTFLEEVDPTVPFHVKTITESNITNWNSAFGWGNHASIGYLTDAPNDGSYYARRNGAWQSFTPGAGGSSDLIGLTDTPVAYTGAALYLLRVNAGAVGVEFVDGSMLYANVGHTHAWSDITSGVPTTLGGYGITDAVPNSRTVTAGSGLTGGGDLTANRSFAIDSTYTGFDNYYTQTQINNFFGGSVAITGYNKTNWDNAFGWGNHASAGYVTSIAHNHGIANSAGTQQFTFGIGDDFRIAGGGDTTVSFDPGTKTITISASGGGDYTESTSIILNGTSFERAALTGDVTATQNGNSTTIANSAVTLAKMANLAPETIIGNNTGVSAVPIALSAAQVRTLLNVADGANNYTHPNHTGDVTSTGDGATVIANNVVSNIKLRDSVALSVIGRSSNTTGDPADIAAASDHQVLRRSGTSIGFGAINLASPNAVTGVLPAASGGIESVSVPLNGTATGIFRQFAFDANFIYIAKGTNEWVRATIDTSNWSNA